MCEGCICVCGGVVGLLMCIEQAGCVCVRVVSVCEVCVCVEEW